MAGFLTEGQTGRIHAQEVAPLMLGALALEVLRLQGAPVTAEGVETVLREAHGRAFGLFLASLARKDGDDGARGAVHG